jgi:hypothetical protein
LPEASNLDRISVSQPEVLSIANAIVLLSIGFEADDYRCVRLMLARRIMGKVSLLLLMPLLAIQPIQRTAATEAETTVKAAAENEYELTLKSLPSADVVYARRRLARTAQKTCGAKPILYGRYAFESQEGIADAKISLTLKQFIRCGLASPSSAPQITNTSDGWKPSASDQSLVENQTYQYFSAEDAGDYPAAYAMLEDKMKAATDFNSWQTSAQALRSKTGQVLSRRILKITWYKDPPSAPEPGIYAAADYSGRFENTPIYCGYVAWHRGANGDYQMIREEQKYMDKGAIARMSRDEVQALASKLGCSLH